jgi:probable FeS assembly SUF system protein SufT
MTPPQLKHQTSNEGNSGLIDDEVIWEQLSTCYDPEIPINIVELGLVYRCDVFYEETGNRVEIDLTLTAPGCGMGPFLVDDIVSKVRQVPNVSLVDVELVFDPPWSQEMMSEAARLETGLY